MIKLWRFLSVSIVVAVCLGLLLVPAVSVTLAGDGGPGGTAGIEALPGKAEVGFNEAFTVNITIDNPANEGVNTVAAEINFTPGLISATNITIDPLWTLVPLKTYDNTAGTISIAAGIIGANSTASSIPVATISMLSNNAALSGIADIDFVYISGERETRVYEDINGTDILNWADVVSGTVKIGGPPAISSVSPDNLTFNATVGKNPPARMLEVCNTGTGMLDWSLSDNAGWLSETPTSGSLSADECEDVTVSVDVAGMEAGDYSATIAVTGSAGVAVKLHIGSATPAPPVEPANLSVSSVTISPQQVKPGEEVTISINVANTGGETGNYSAVLYINGVVEGSQSVSVAPGMTENVVFTVSKSQAGVYDVLIAEQSGQFEVVSAGWFGGGLNTSGIVAIVLIVIAIILALVFILRRTRRAV